MSKPTAIEALSDNVINQIAAGEVIERPASIVKELVENSLDAGAAKISIELHEGGIDGIRIHDDGHGIPPDQLHLALSRHCTSKLREATELASIASLGFRGEALASISSVAEITIISRTSDQAHGWRVDMHPGAQASRPRAQAHAVGTTVEVRSLFATTPVRRKFLKQSRTEFLHIQQFVRRAGFCYPEVAFTLTHGAKQSLSLSGPMHASGIERRWRTLFGAEFLEHSLAIEFHTPEVTVRGWAGSIGYSRQNSDLQFIAINRRLVRDRHIAHAIRMAYELNIEQGRQPGYAVHIEMPESEVDVNVHPGKAEVRFHDPRGIHDIVYAAVKQALHGEQLTIESRSGYEPPAQVNDSSRLAEPSYRARTSPRQYANKPSPPEILSSSANKLLAIAAHRFAFCDDDGSIFVTDLHAAITSLVTMRLERGERESRPLIVPETIRADLSDEWLEVLAAFGVELARLGETALVLRAVPVVVREIDQCAFAQSLLAGANARIAPVAAIAAAAADGFRAPDSELERRRWFAQLANQIDAFGLDLRHFCIVLKPETLLGLFGSRQAR